MDQKTNKEKSLLNEAIGVSSNSIDSDDVKENQEINQNFQKKSILKEDTAIDESISKESSEKNNIDSDIKIEAPNKTRKDLQIPRRLFHFGCGITSGLIYQIFLTHKQAVYILGIAASLMYVIEQLRINYPNTKVLKQLNRYFLRAEEQLKESAAIPYIMALLLTIISFPKSIALVAIYTLATADPLSAIIGIRFGRRKIVKEKSVEGSLAFLFASFVVCFSVLYSIEGNPFWAVIAVSCFSSIFITAFEMAPIKLDDNLTIPLMTASILWVITTYVGLNVI